MRLEVIDIRSLVPLDTQTILESEKTKHVLIVHEAVQFCGQRRSPGQIADSDAFYYLDAPIKRVRRQEHAYPFNPIWRRKPSPRSKS